jgi:chemotaxis protein CheZ
VQRKVFRVEQWLGKSRARAPAPEHRAANNAANNHAGMPEVVAELLRMRDIIGRKKRELEALQGDDRRMVRAAGELNAAIEGMEQATQTILKSTEAIDEDARALAAAVKTSFARGLAQDIQEQALHIYEACNFHDLAGQRLGKVMATLNAIEQHMSRMLERWDAIGEAPQSATSVASKHARGRSLINGPKLDGDAGHASQCDIDAMFG